MDSGLPKELMTLIVRSDPPAKAGLGPNAGGLVASGSSAPPEAVPRVTDEERGPLRPTAGRTWAA